MPLYKRIEMTIFWLAVLFVFGRASAVLFGLDIAPIQQQYLVMACVLMFIAVASSSSVLEILAGQKSLLEKIARPFDLSWCYLSGFVCSFVAAWMVSGSIPAEWMIAEGLPIRLLSFMAVLVVGVAWAQYQEVGSQAKD